MSSKWDQYSRVGLDVASTATSLGFSAAKVGTKLGFSITRGIASTAVGITGSAVDRAFFGGNVGAGPMLGGAVSTAISTIESLVLAPILIGESVTSTSLVAAQSSLSALAAIFPGSDEASFSLASFIGLVRREWTDPAEREGLPEERYGLAKIMKALAGWATLQGVTSQWQERQWFEVMKEIQVNDEADTDLDPPSTGTDEKHADSTVHITTDVIYPSHGGQIVTADIGTAATPGSTNTLISRHVSSDIPSLMPNTELKYTLRRLSKMVLAGYGGPSLLFFGVSPWSTSTSTEKGSSSRSAPKKEKRTEEAELTSAVAASEAETSSNVRPRTRGTDVRPEPDQPSYSWWNVLLGRHDHDIFLQNASFHPPTTSTAAMGSASTSDQAEIQLPPRPPTVFRGSENLMPRFWVLTDHARREVVLVIRGTMSLNEIAVDLTCEAAPFELHIPRPRHSASMSNRARTEPEPVEDEGEAWSEFDEELETIPGSFPIDISTPPPLPKQPRPRPSSNAPAPPQADLAGQSETDDPRSSSHLVHGGMLKMARAMGAPGKPVHVAVRDALKRNRGYSLVLCGHSLGAGVAALLALMWANPYTRLTHKYSGLPRRRRVSAYCFAPPCLTSPELTKLAGESGLITSFIYAHDVVSRLSLGSVRDLTRCAAWLCQAEVAHGEGYSNVTKRALRWKAGVGEEGDDVWFLAMRKTLEANMHMTQLFPPGHVLWALRDGDLDPAHRLHDVEGGLKKGGRGGEKIRLFEVLDVERAFGQIVFARDMLSSHLPHQYDRVLHELL